MGMSADDAATLAIGSPTISTPTTKPTSVDDAAAMALHQGDAATVATVKNNIYNATATNPDTAAANQSLAKQIGAPVDSVAANPVPAQQQAAAQNINVSDLIKTAPATTSFLSNPANAAIAHDDVTNLVGLELSMSRNTESAAPYNPSIGETIRNWIDDNTGATARRVAQSANDYSIEKAALDAGETPEQFRAKLGGDGEMPDQFVNKLVNMASFGFLPDMAGAARTAGGGVAGGLGSLAGFMTPGGPLKATEFLGSKMGFNLFEHTAQESFVKAVLKDAGHGAATLGTATALSQLGENIDSPDIGSFAAKEGGALKSGAEMGAIFGVAGRALPDNTLAQTAARIGIVNAAMDAFNGTSPLDKRPLEQKIFDYGMNTFFALKGAGRVQGGWVTDAPKNETNAADGAPPDDGGSSGATVASLFKTFASAIAPHIQNVGKATAANAAAEKMAQVNALATESKVRARDPSAFQTFMNDASQNAPIQDLYIDAKTFAQAAGDKLSAITQAMPDIADQLPTAMTTATDIRIPVADFATHLAGSDMAAALIPHLKTDPEAFSQAEAQEYLKTMTPQIEADVQKALKVKEEKAATQASSDAVHDSILTQLTDANRFTPDVNKPYAQLLSSFYDTMSKRAGATPEDLLQQFPVKIKAESAGGGFDQVAAPNKISMETSDEELNAMYPRVGDKVSGLSVRDHVPNMSSIDSSLENPEVLPGVRELPFSLFNGPGEKTPRTEQLASDINDSGEINPLIVVADKEGHYILEGAHRYDALQHLGKETFPARVVLDLDSLPDSFKQDKLGAFNPKTLTISVMKGANLSTFLHESGHFFLQTLTDIASKDGAPEGIKADTQTLMDWFGVKDAAAWKDMSLDEQRDAHEKFARSFEKYLLDGDAPSLELQPIFSRFRSWLLNVYKSVSDFLVGHPEAGHISPEVRGVFDRMLATDEQIGKAESARGMTPLFATPEAAGMKPEEFNAYADTAQKATDTATTELDARRLRDMQYASNARSEAIKGLQRDAASKRAAIREEVTKEVNKEPVYRAENFIRRGELDEEQMKGMSKDERRAVTEMGMSKTKLDLGDLKQMYGDKPNALWRYLDTGKSGLAANDGLHPDTLAEMFKFNSGDELVRELVAREDKAEKIRGMTDQRMLERHGDLTDPKAIAAAADRAIHNDVRTKLISTELNALNKQLGNKSLLTKVAKQFAEQVVARLPANKINPNLYIAAAAKAGKLADAAFKSGDIKEAAEQKKNQLINQYAVKAAFEQKALVEKGLTFLKRFGNNAYREKIPGAYLEQIDGLLAKYDLRKNPSDKPSRAEQNLTKWVTSQREAGFEPYVPDFILTGDAMHYGDLSVEQFRGLVDTVRSMKHMADALKEVTIAGQKMAVETAVQELMKPLIERGTKFTKEDLLNPPEIHTDSFFSVALHEIGSTLRLVDSDLKPQEFKRNEYDLHQLDGPFGKMLFEPMFERNYWKVQQLKEISTKFGEYGAKLGKEWQKGLYDLVQNKTLLDPDLSTETDPVPMKITRAKMLGIARHVGNESNFDKLTRGYNWKPADVWNFLHDNMTEKDWQATQAQWDIFEKYWPEIEGLARRLGGVPPDKIPLRPFETKFGRTEGGYAPIDYDPIRSKLSAKFGDIMAEPHEQIGSEPAYKATTTFNGSMQNRAAGYTDRINLDYHGVESRLRDTIHDLAYREVLIDTNKMITNPAFRSQFMGTFGREDYKGLQSWMRGIRDMNKDESQIKGFEKFLQYARTGVVMTGIAYRLSTVLKHGSSVALKSLGYLGDGTGAKYFAARAARMATGNAQADIAGAMTKFPEIASRMNQMDRDYKVGTKSMYHAEDWRAKNDRFGHAMVAWSDMLTAVPTAWAAYDRATIEGIPESLGGTGEPMTDKQAIAYANKVVREAHGTALEANRSLFLQARGVKGLFGTIYGFMNNTYGQLGDLMDKTVVGGHFQNKPVLVARAMATIIAPAMMAAWVSGQFNNKDPWYKQAGKAVLGEVAGTVPFVRDAWSMIERGDTSSAGESAPLRLVGDAVKTALDAYKGAHGQSSKWIRDTANAIGELFHIGGLGQAGKSLQYLADVHSGKQNPKGAHEFVTGVTIGPRPKE